MSGLPHFVSNQQQLAQPHAVAPLRYYDVQFVATMLGLSEWTVYQASAGRKKIQVPQATRLGRTVRFLGQHILDFVGENGGAAAVAAHYGAQGQQDQVAAVTKPPVAPARPRGRPRKVGPASAGGTA